MKILSHPKSESKTRNQKNYLNFVAKSFYCSTCYLFTSNESTDTFRRYNYNRQSDFFAETSTKMWWKKSIFPFLIPSSSFFLWFFQMNFLNSTFFWHGKEKQNKAKHFVEKIYTLPLQSMQYSLHFKCLPLKLPLNEKCFCNLSSKNKI